MNRRLSSKFRLTFGLVLLLISLLLVSISLNLLPDRTAAIRDGRANFAEATAISVGNCVSRRNWTELKANLTTLVQRNDQLLSCAVRRQSGKTVVEIGDHDSWAPVAGRLSTETQVLLPVFVKEQQWGQLELRFNPLSEGFGLLALLPLRLIAFLGGASFLLFYWYLGKMLQQLDPSKAIPPRVRSALDTMAEGLVVLDTEGRIVLANEAFARVIDQSSDSLIGLNILSFKWQHEDRQPIKSDSAPWKQSLSSGEPVRDFILHLDQGDAETKKSFLCNCTPVLGNGNQFGGILVSLDDITLLEKKKLELSEARHEAVEANQAKSRFLANMSHEIRTPMNAILGFTDVLLRKENQTLKERRQHLGTIQSSGKYLLNLINDVLDLSKVEAEKLQLEIVEFNPFKLVNEVIHSLEVKADEKRIGLSQEYKGLIPVSIQSDPGRIRQILTNLIGNAIKFTENGQVVVTTSMTQVRGKAKICFKVSDTGIGISDEAKKQLFQPFVQANAGISRRFGGTGLGLSISKRLAEALGGQIEVASQLGQGTTFSVLIDPGPLTGIRGVEVTSEELDQLAEEISTGQHAGFPGLRVLVVDDAQENRDLLEIYLDELSAECDTASNGAEAIAKSVSGNWDVVLMDMQMPVMDGFSAVKKLRESGYQVPIIAVTADAMSEARSRCLSAGCDGFITKPVVLKQLVEVVSQVTKLQPSETSPQAIEADGAGEDSGHSSLEGPIVCTLPVHRARYRRIAESFVTTISERACEFRSAWDQGDMQTLNDLGHWLKGSAPNCGFGRLGEIGMEIETAAAGDNVDSIPEKIEQLHQLVELLVIEAGEQSGESES